MAKKILMVTGGTRGIGAAVALGAAKQGYDLCLTYRDKDARAEDMLKQVRALGAKAILAKGDVADEKAVVAMFETCDKALGKLTHLVNSAGIAGPGGRVEALSAELLNLMFTVNITGSFLCAREAIKRMSTKHGGNGGVIVNLSSAASRLGAPGGGVHYAASKGAIDSFNWGLAQEVAGEGIRVNSVRPGVIDTEIQPPGRAEKMGPLIPLQRAGQAHEVATAILWLLSDEASYTTGANLDVSGAR